MGPLAGLHSTLEALNCFSHSFADVGQGRTGSFVRYSRRMQTVHEAIVMQQSVQRLVQLPFICLWW